jgi:type VI secretion system protein
MEARNRILERIADLEEGGENQALSRFERVAASIRTHLSRILKTRRGSVPISESFGIPDLSNVAGSFETGSPLQIVTAVLETIARYEPRLLNPRVRAMDDTPELAALRIEISGEIPVNEQKIPIQISALVKANGEIILM